jgi:hypothetical protein
MGEEASSDMTEVDMSGTPVTGPRGLGMGGWFMSDMCLQERGLPHRRLAILQQCSLVLAVGCGAQARNEGHLVDALALRGDEGRSTLR